MNQSDVPDQRNRGNDKIKPGEFFSVSQQHTWLLSCLDPWGTPGDVQIVQQGQGQRYHASKWKPEDAFYPGIKVIIVNLDT